MKARDNPYFRRMSAAQIHVISDAIRNFPRPAGEGEIVHRLAKAIGEEIHKTVPEFNMDRFLKNAGLRPEKFVTEAASLTLDEAKDKLGQAYQVVGTLCGVLDGLCPPPDEVNMHRALDYLADETFDPRFLPWPKG